MLALLRFSGCTADSHLAAEAFGDEIEARGFLVPADFGNPAQVMGLVEVAIRMRPRRVRGRTRVAAMPESAPGSDQVREVARLRGSRPRLGADKRCRVRLVTGRLPQLRPAGAPVYTRSPLVADRGEKCQLDDVCEIGGHRPGDLDAGP